jgi:hypothetical protein
MAECYGRHRVLASVSYLRHAQERKETILRNTISKKKQYKDTYYIQAQMAVYSMLYFYRTKGKMDNYCIFQIYFLISIIY